jgi:hypothetical protein
MSLRVPADLIVAGQVIVLVQVCARKSRHGAIPLDRLELSRNLGEITGSATALTHACMGEW